MVVTSSQVINEGSPSGALALLHTLNIMGNWFHCTSEAALFDRECKEIETSVIPVRINGYEYEIREVHRCLSEGLKESRLLPHSSTRAVMKIMDKCRRDWGMVFPDEK